VDQLSAASSWEISNAAPVPPTLVFAWIIAGLAGVSVCQQALGQGVFMTKQGLPGGKAIRSGTTRCGAPSDVHGDMAAVRQEVVLLLMAPTPFTC
jgi:hypothetical protein